MKKLAVRNNTVSNFLSTLEKKELNMLFEDFFLGGLGLANSLQTLEKVIFFLSFLSFNEKNEVVELYALRRPFEL